jgi:putative oxygen-independent coproporphyrinogen III oxidase
MTSGRRPGLYLHIPFCSAVCPYCDFSVQRVLVKARERFVGHLVEEVALAAPSWADPRPFDTVYFGGGTPSLLLAEELARILDACRAQLALTPEPWVYLEANPEDVTPSICAAWRRLGVRTLSLGVQSFADDALRFLERHHDAQQAREAVEVAHESGFDTVSIDLIFGLPGQTETVWRQDLEMAVALRPGHISCYQLTIHERTRFALARRRGELVEMPEEEQAALYALTHGVVGGAGYSAYEVSNFALGPEHESRHNRKYWDHTPYLGLGPSAHSLAMEDDHPAPSARRWWNALRTPQWETRVADGERPIEGGERLGRRELATEAVLLGLRTAGGIDLDAFGARFGVDLLEVNDALVARLEAEGKLARGIDPDGTRRLAPTVAGLAVADGLAALFEIGTPTSLEA